METFHPLVYLVGAIVGLGVLARLAQVLIVPMVREAFADARQGAINLPSLVAPVVGALVWLGLVLAVVSVAVRALA